MRRSTIFWGSLFILLGALVLLENLDIIDINVWALIWPFFLIAVGLWVLLGAVAVFDPGLAGGCARSQALLSDRCDLRHSR